MDIRRGQKSDSEAIAGFLMMAMEDIAYRFIGREDYQEAFDFLKTLVELEGNQYSYSNNWVLEDDGVLVGTALLYDGADLAKLREPVAALVAERYQLPFNPEHETEAGEIYIDCIAVDPNQQGKGIGSKLLGFLINEYIEKNQQTLGLLVDLDNPKAKKLYARLGFEVIKEKTLLGKQLEQMQFKANRGTS
ncbi:GNAT family N-acetyltransferase [Sphingobacterium kyonggiense]